MKTVPRKLGRWKVLRPLGMGGMGAVYLVQRGSTLGAAKVIHPALLTQGDFRLRFVREVELARQVQSRHAAAVLDADTEGATPWFVSEFIDGPTLEQYVAAHGALDGGQIRALQAALWTALADVHSAGVVHRDVKPGNVLLSPKGPVLVDFGIAAGGEFTSITRTGDLLGSTNWMSPEQVNGSSASAASDVFSMAATIAFAGTGRPPFGSGAAALRRIADSQPPDLAGLPEDTAKGLKTAFNADPLDRPTAEMLKGSAEIAADDRSGDVTFAATFAATSHSSNARPRRKRSPLVLAGTAALVLTCSTAGAALLLETGPIQGSRPKPSAESTSVSAVNESSGESGTRKRVKVPRPQRIRSVPAPVQQADVPLVALDVDVDDWRQLRDLGKTLASHVQESVRLNLEFYGDKASIQGTLDGTLEMSRSCGGGGNCPPGQITGLYIYSDRPTRDTSFGSVADRWIVVGTFFIQAVDVATGGIYVVSMRSDAPASGSSSPGARYCDFVESRPKAYPGFPIAEGSGSSPEDILIVQDLINSQIFRSTPDACLEEDGVFGEATLAAVKERQAFFSLPATGKVDEILWSLLMTYFEGA